MQHRRLFVQYKTNMKSRCPNCLLNSSVLVLVKALGDQYQPNSLANVMCCGTNKTVTIKQRKNNAIHQQLKVQLSS